MKALIIIDMQIGCFTSSRSTFDKEGVVKRINILIDWFRNAKNPIIFIQHNGSRQNSLIPDTEDWQIIPSLKRSPNDIIINKTVNDSFYNTDLKTILDKNGIDTLIISGYATDFCVDTTIRSALNKDYKVIVVKDGHTTFNRSSLDADNIIKHHNILWEYLLPTQYKIDVKTCEQLINEFNEVK